MDSWSHRNFGVLDDERRLIGASVQFFERQFPKISRNVLLVIHTVIALAVANLGLATLMNVVVPMMYFCYPITIAVVLVSLVDIFLPGHLYYSYRCAVWTAAIFGLIDAVHQGFALFNAAEPAWFENLIDVIPLADLSLGWVVPLAVLLLIGLVLDWARGNFKRDAEAESAAAVTTSAPEASVQA